MSNLISFGITDFYTLEQLKQITLIELQAKPTLAIKHAHDLKLEGMLIEPDPHCLYDITLSQFRLWLAHSMEDGEDCSNVMLEIFDKNCNGKAAVQQWQAPTK